MDTGSSDPANTSRSSASFTGLRRPAASRSQAKYAEIHSPEARATRKAARPPPKLPETPLSRVPNTPLPTYPPFPSTVSPQYTPGKGEVVATLSGRQRDIAQTLTEQMLLLSDRNESAQAYLRALQNQIAATLTTALEAVDSEKERITRDLDNYVKEERAFLQATAASKQEVLTALAEECSRYAEKVKAALVELEALEKAPNGYSEAVDLAEAVAVLSTPEPDYPYVWAQVAERQFRFVLHRKRPHETSSKHLKTEKRKKSQTTSDLTKAYKELETLYKEAKQQPVPPVESKNRLLEGLQQRLS